MVVTVLLFLLILLLLFDISSDFFLLISFFSSKAPFVMILFRVVGVGFGGGGGGGGGGDLSGDLCFLMGLLLRCSSFKLMLLWLFVSSTPLLLLLASLFFFLFLTFLLSSSSWPLILFDEVEFDEFCDLSFSSLCLRHQLQTWYDSAFGYRLLQYLC